MMESSSTEDKNISYSKYLPDVAAHIKYLASITDQRKQASFVSFSG